MKPSVLAAVSQRDPYLVVLGGLALVGFGVRLFDRRFPSEKGHRSSVGNALMRMEASFLPGREHIVEAAEREDVEEDDQGEPPGPGHVGPDQRN